LKICLVSIIKRVKKFYQAARNYIATKQKGGLDSPEIRAIKGLIRQCEAKATCRYVGLKEHQYHFQNLPFYETGKIEKNPMGEADVLQYHGTFTKNSTASNLLCG